MSGTPEALPVEGAYEASDVHLKKDISLFGLIALAAPSRPSRRPGAPPSHRPLVESSSPGSVKGRSCASATGRLTSFPSSVLRPSRRAGSTSAAPTTPCRATRTRYGRVAEVRAWVDVRATAPGMFATQ